jgi:hypothetical protein
VVEWLLTQTRTEQAFRSFESSCYAASMTEAAKKIVLAMICLCPQATSCSDTRFDAGLDGRNRIVAITWSAVSGEPFLSTQITVDKWDRAKLVMRNANGPLPVQTVRAPNGSFETIAMKLAQFRQVHRDVRSECRGYSDTFPITIRWHYENGDKGSYSAKPGCALQDEQRFLQAATSIAIQVGLRTSILKAPTP